MILRIAETVPWTGGYSSSVHSAWSPGEVREVDEDEAARLLATFPGLFAVVVPATLKDTGPDPVVDISGAVPPPIVPPKKKPSRRR